MDEVILKGRKIVGGRVEGEALVSHEDIGYLSSVEPSTGIVREKNHELEGVNLAGKILVYPTGKGSTGGSFTLYEMALCKTAPKGIINIRAEPITATGAIISNIPMIDQLNGNPIEIIKTGDYLELDGDKGIVKIKKNYQEVQSK